MASFWITFRLRDDLTYPRRYAAFMQAVNECGSDYWREPTSFVAFSSKYEIDPIGAHLKPTINPATDIFVVRQIGSTDTRYAGTPDNPREFNLHFPDAKKL